VTARAAAAGVLVTGAGSGIGLATSVHLAERGFRVYASVPVEGQRADVEAAAAARGVRVRVVLLDVTDPASISSAVEAVRRETGGLHGVVNSAGLGLRGFFEDLSPAEIRRLFDVNVFGAMAVTRAVLPHMRAARAGRIVLITSAGGRIANMTVSAYCAGKFALEGFGESLAMEVSPFGVRVSLIEPGLVMTPHFTVNRGAAGAAARAESPFHARFMRHERMVDEILRQGRITPADVARAVHRALAEERPRLRYAVGWRARALLSLRRHLPDEAFTRLYFRQVSRLVDRPAGLLGPERAAGAR
jgi:NAD(P)-dependent dehydrogenase (short-subunit alcohol dehydrogenase family)